MATNIEEFGLIDCGVVLHDEKFITYAKVVLLTTGVVA